MIDPLGKLIGELRSEAALVALVGVDANGRERIRGGEPGPGDVAKPYQAFVVLTRLGVERMPRVPIQRVSVGYRCYGTTPQNAAAVYGALSDAVHNVGPRIGVTGVVIFRSFDDTGGAAGKDPDTSQPYEDGVIVLHAATQAAA